MANDDLLQQIREAIREEVAPLNKRLSRIESQLTELKETVSVAINVFDQQGNKLRKRVDRLEDALNLPPFEN